MTVSSVILANAWNTWSPAFVVAASVIVAFVTGKYQVKSVRTSPKSAEDSVLLTGYNQLVSSLQQQINEVQADNVASTARAIQAEATAQLAILATQECEKRREEDRRQYQDQIDAIVAKQKADISMLTAKHDRELAALSREIAAIRSKQQQGDT